MLVKLVCHVLQAGLQKICSNVLFSFQADLGVKEDLEVQEGLEVRATGTQHPLLAAMVDMEAFLEVALAASQELTHKPMRSQHMVAMEGTARTLMQLAVVEAAMAVVGLFKNYTSLQFHPQKVSTGSACQARLR